MKYTGPIYRPPYEANTLLLQVTVGCAHNKCTFCTMYRDVQFSMEKLDQIERDLQEAKQQHPNVRRVFLVNGDAFVLSARRLKPIAELIHKYLPKVETITMYASVSNIKGKTNVELQELRDLRINDLWVGAETGHAETLKYLNKGASLEDSQEQLKRLNKAGIDFFFGFMFGAAGSGKGMENAIATAKLINETKPIGIVPTTLGANGGSPLAHDIEKGVYQLATELEVLEEQKKLIDLIEIETEYLGIHGINTVPFDSLLPRDKEKSIQRVDAMIERLDHNYLNSIPERHSI
ncbi:MULTISPECIES: radical SAM protein [unclassified Lentimicrobium]|uniref:radical SAM protein n=1 Tax=unclassified Lentimicrobium TaxID=2677434 RepID=UPI001555FF73|nr:MULTISPECIES: radical SAM protein [unclassified Lentimicrobium]NPD46937.1 radical SAM protein [Lentimicrobium sp. S6]NPD84140.1 radical SAM protein [Lentimicrobium sp. L6]